MALTGRRPAAVNVPKEQRNPQQAKADKQFEAMDRMLLARSMKNQPAERDDAGERRTGGWIQHLWSDEANDWLVRTHYPEFYKTVYREMKGIYRIDVVRFAYMHRYGGIYADLDFVAIRRWDELLQSRGRSTSQGGDVLLPSFFSKRQLRRRYNATLLSFGEEGGEQQHGGTLLTRSAAPPCNDLHHAYLADRLRPEGIAAEFNATQVARWRREFLEDRRWSAGASSFDRTATSSGRCGAPPVLVSGTRAFDVLAIWPNETDISAWREGTCTLESNLERWGRYQNRQRFYAEGFTGEAFVHHTVPNALMISRAGEDFWLYCMNLTAQIWMIESRSPPEGLARSWSITVENTSTPEPAPDGPSHTFVASPEYVSGPALVHRAASSYRGQSRVELLPRLVAYSQLWVPQRVCGVGYDDDVDDEAALEYGIDDVERSLLGAEKKAVDTVFGKKSSLVFGQSRSGAFSKTHVALLRRLQKTDLRASYAVTFWGHSWDWKSARKSITASQISKENFQAFRTRMNQPSWLRDLF